MASRRSKKKGIVVNHLANFEHAPGNSPPEGRGYNHYQRSYNQSSRYQGSKSSGSRYSKKEYVNTYRHKEQFLNANFRFVLSRQNEAIQPHYVDPDSPIEWDDLEQLCLYSVTDYECPICLERPVAGKITKCGHVFCWPCLLQFFSNAQGGFDRWKGCPCCAESISIDCIKTTLVHTTKSFSQGDQITFSLIQREKTSMVAMPRCKWNAKTAREFLDCESEDSVYSRLSTVKDKKSLIRREMVELSSYKDFQKINSPYFDLALSKLSDQLTQLVIEENKAEMARQEQQAASKPSGPFIEIDGAKVELTENSTDWEQDQGVVEKEAPAAVPRPVQNEVFYSVGDAVTIQRPDLFHFYYQEMGGQQIFLDHIAIRALFAQYGSPLSLPDKITATVLEIKESTVDDRLKRRIKYLDHLPTKATVYFCEIDLEHSGIVTRETLFPFLKEIRQNASKRESDLRSSQKQNESLPLFEYDPLNPPVPLPIMPEVDLSNITPELFPTLKSSLSDSQLSADESEALSLSYARALDASFVDLDDEFENPPLGFNSAAFPPLSGAWSGSSSSSSSSSPPASTSAPPSSLSTPSPEPSKPASPAKKGRGKKGGRTVISLSSLHKN